MSGFQHVGSLIEGLGARLQYVDGSCGEHGASKVLARSGAGWYCPHCLDQQKRPDFDAIWAKDRREHVAKAADIPARYRGQSFKGLTDEHKAIRAIAARFRDAITPAPRWAVLLMVGEVGTGKTLLACELTEAYIAKTGRSARYITARGMISEIQSSYGREGKAEETEIARFARYDLLVLDEIDAVSDKDNAKLLLTEVVNRRYSNNKPMIAITNQKLDTLKDFVGDRVHDRLRDNAYPCNFPWESQRAFA